MEEKKILSTEGFFRKSTFCTLMVTNPGFDGHWVMPEIFLLNGTFTMLEMTAFLLKTFFNSMHWFKSTMQWFNIAKLAIFKVALLHQCMEMKKVFNKKAGISSIVKVPFSKNISCMSQCPSNPGFASVKVQNVDFLKKAFRRQYFFLFPYVLLTCYHHLRAKLGGYIALCIFLNF